VLLSFYSLITGDVNLGLSNSRLFTPEAIKLIKQAKAVVLPRYCRACQYWFCKNHAPVFPNLDTQFRFKGKFGHTFVFSLCEVPYPPTKLYTGIEDFKERHLRNNEPLFSYPFVVKWNKGGGGAFVYKVYDKQGLFEALRTFKRYEHRGPTFVIQPYIEHGGRDLRVVVIGESLLTYWRVQTNPQEFRTNVGRGGEIEYNIAPALEEKTIKLVKKICDFTGINLAAFDVLFPKQRPDPLFLEINYQFGLKGIGGHDAYKQVLRKEVKKWWETVRN
jgi:ribosomal protein S6--L-glutamate ligase